MTAISAENSAWLFARLTLAYLFDFLHDATSVCRAKRKPDGITVALKKISVDVTDERAKTKCLKEVRY